MATNSDILKPGQVIRPKMSEQTATDLVRTLYGLTVVELQELPSYDDRNYLVTVDGRHSNPYIGDVWPHGYVLKVLNSLDSQKPHVDAQNEMMKILDENNIGCPRPVLNLNGHEKSVEKIFADPQDAAGSFNLHVVRLLTFIPGQRLVTVPYTAGLMYDAGQTLGAINKALEGYRHPALDQHETIWVLRNVPRLRQFTFAITDDDKRQLVEDVIGAFEREVIPNIPHFSEGAIHGDYNEQNVLVGPDPATSGDHRVVAIIDFGDATRSPYVFEMSVALMYAMLDSRLLDPFEASGHFLAGYLSRRHLTSVELAAVRTCVAARYVTSLTMGAYSYSLEPKNEYLKLTAVHGWSMLRRLWVTSTKEELYSTWNAVLASYGLDGQFLFG